MEENARVAEFLKAYKAAEKEGEAQKGEVYEGESEEGEDGGER